MAFLAPDHLFDFTVAQPDQGIREGGGFDAVSRDDGGGVLFAGQALEQFEDNVSGGGVEISGRLVGKKKARGMDQRTGNRNPLHLASGKLVRKAIAKAIELDPCEALACRFACARFSRQKEGQFHVFESREGVKQLKGLKYEADFFSPQRCETRIVQRGSGNAIQQDVTGGGEIHRTGEMEQR